MLKLKICTSIKETPCQPLRMNRVHVCLGAVQRDMFQPLGLQLGLGAVPFTQSLTRKTCQPQGTARNRLIMLTNHRETFTTPILTGRQTENTIS